MQPPKSPMRSPVACTTPSGSLRFARLEGAQIRALDDAGAEAGSGFTAADGTASLALAPGTYTLEVSAAGHETFTSDAFDVVLANLTALEPILLAATAGEVNGTVAFLQTVFQELMQEGYG